MMISDFILLVWTLLVAAVWHWNGRLFRRTRHKLCPTELAALIKNNHWGPAAHPRAWRVNGLVEMLAHRPGGRAA